MRRGELLCLVESIETLSATSRAPAANFAPRKKRTMMDPWTTVAGSDLDFFGLLRRSQPILDLLRICRVRVLDPNAGRMSDRMGRDNVIPGEASLASGANAHLIRVISNSCCARDPWNGLNVRISVPPTPDSPIRSTCTTEVSGQRNLDCIGCDLAGFCMSPTPTDDAPLGRSSARGASGRSQLLHVSNRRSRHR